MWLRIIILTDCASTPSTAFLMLRHSFPEQLADEVEQLQAQLNRPWCSSRRAI